MAFDDEITIERSQDIGTDGYKIRTKGMTSARKVPEEQQVRDLFMTPNYAVDILIPHIPKDITLVWEPACGTGKISGKLRNSGYTVFESDIAHEDSEHKFNFITGQKKNLPEKISIITNPPFSIKDLFIERCFEYERPFAMLINADYSQQQISWIKRGCEKIIPTSRISYITPNILKRIHEGEVWKIIRTDYVGLFDSIDEIKKAGIEKWNSVILSYKDVHNYKTLEEVPQDLLYRYSSAQFHSMWLTYGFNLGRTETFVDLPVDQRKNNI